MSQKPEISVVVPVYNEEENIRPFIEEIVSALTGIAEFEILYIDDGSQDKTSLKMAVMAAEVTELRTLRHIKCCGQSAAIATGIKAAAGRYIATLDGDGQNDPANIPDLLKVLRQAGDPDRLLVAGWRAKRRDTTSKRWQSKIANAVRSRMLADNTPDTGCGLKVFTREAFMDMPHFDHMHRFLPALMIRRGGRVESVQVNHRQRERGESKYGLWGRLKVGIVDIFGVMWLCSRGSTPQVEETTPRREA